MGWVEGQLDNQISTPCWPVCSHVFSYFASALLSMTPCRIFIRSGLPWATLYSAWVGQQSFVTSRWTRRQCPGSMPSYMQRRRRTVPTRISWTKAGGSASGTGAVTVSQKCTLFRFLYRAGQNQLVVSYIVPHKKAPIVIYFIHQLIEMSKYKVSRKNITFFPFPCVSRHLG